MKLPSVVRSDGGSGGRDQGGGEGRVPNGGSGGSEDSGDDASEGKGPVMVPIGLDALKKILETPASGTSSGNPFAIFSLILATFIATWTKIDRAVGDLKTDLTKDIASLNTNFCVFATFSVLAFGYLIVANRPARASACLSI